MKEFLFKKNIEENEYQAFIKKAQNVSFMQDSKWANVKDNWKPLCL